MAVEFGLVQILSLCEQSYIWLHVSMWDLGCLKCKVHL